MRYICNDRLELRTIHTIEKREYSHRINEKRKLWLFDRHNRLRLPCSHSQLVFLDASHFQWLDIVEWFKAFVFEIHMCIQQSKYQIRDDKYVLLHRETFSYHIYIRKNNGKHTFLSPFWLKCQIPTKCARWSRKCMQIFTFNRLLQ